MRVAVVAAKRKRISKTAASHWGVRLAGVALCLFFALGVMTGLSRPGRAFAARVEAWLAPRALLERSGIAPALFAQGAMAAPAAASPVAPAAAIALVERGDGFYLLDARGALRGPVAAAAQGDLPILSGAAVDRATPRQLLADAAAMVRAEAELNAVVSELRIGGDGVATAYLDRAPIGISFDLDRAGAELHRAARILGLWRGHERMIAAIDLTEEDAAVVRIRGAAADGGRRPGGARKVAYTDSARGRREEGGSR